MNQSPTGELSNRDGTVLTGNQGHLIKTKNLPKELHRHAQRKLGNKTRELWNQRSKLWEKDNKTIRFGLWQEEEILQAHVHDPTSIHSLMPQQLLDWVKIIWTPRQGCSKSPGIGKETQAIFLTGFFSAVILLDLGETRACISTSRLNRSFLFTSLKTSTSSSRSSTLSRISFISSWFRVWKKSAIFIWCVPISKNDSLWAIDQFTKFFSPFCSFFFVLVLPSLKWTPGMTSDSQSSSWT